MNEKKARVFISIEIPQSIKLEIEKIQKTLPKFMGKTYRIEKFTPYFEVFG